MMDLKMISLNSTNIKEHGCYCLKNVKQRGYAANITWKKKRFDEGLKVKILSSKEEGQIGIIEYTSGEYSWRGFTDPDYMFIHCLYIGKKKDRNRNYGKLLIDQCKDEAKLLGKKGVAVIASGKAMLAERNVFLKNGFVCAEKHESGYELLVFPFSQGPMPELAKSEVPEVYNQGLHLLYAYQCPYFQKSIEGMERAASEMGISLNLVELSTAGEAQKAPSLYGVFNLIHNGELIAEHYISEKRFRNIMKSRL